MIEKQLKIIQESLTGIQQDIKDLLDNMAATDEERKNQAIGEAGEAARLWGGCVYVVEQSGGWRLTYTAPSKYYEGDVIAVRANGETRVLHFDGCKGDD